MDVEGDNTGILKDAALRTPYHERDDAHMPSMSGIHKSIYGQKPRAIRKGSHLWRDLPLCVKDSYARYVKERLGLKVAHARPKNSINGLWRLTLTWDPDLFEVPHPQYVVTFEPHIEFHMY